MKLEYDAAVTARLRDWRDSDTPLFERTVTILKQIRSEPATLGTYDANNNSRLISYTVRGRDEEYVITWVPLQDTVAIADVASVADFVQRMKFRAAQGIEPNEG